MSAAFGGTTTVISFAAQHVGMQVEKVVEDYPRARPQGRGHRLRVPHHHRRSDAVRARRPAEADPRRSRIAECVHDLRQIRLDDEQLLDVMRRRATPPSLRARRERRHDRLDGKAPARPGYRAPKFHGVSHPRAGEAEAFNRPSSCFAGFLDQPVMIFHVSSAEGIDVIRRARLHGPESVRRDLPAIPVPHRRGHGQRPGASGGRGGSAARRCASAADQEALMGGASLTVRCRPLTRPTMRPTGSTRPWAVRRTAAQVPGSENPQRDARA